MKMKKYYVWNYRDFANTFCLYWADSESMIAALPTGARRITRKEAEALARSERTVKKVLPNDVCGDTAIYPAGVSERELELGFYLNRYIWERNGRRCKP